MLRNQGHIILIMGLAVVAAGCGGGGSGGRKAEPVNLVETARTAGNFTTLITALELTGLDDTLTSDGPFTVFAPTDDAFADLPPGVLDALLADLDTLRQVLLYHVLNDVRTSTDLLAAGDALTLQGESISVTEGSVFVNLSEVTGSDVVATNGTIHVIDKVLVPPGSLDLVDTAIYYEEFPTLVSALVEAELVDLLRTGGPFTVFAPTEEAFAALPEGTLDTLLADKDALREVLLHHVVPNTLLAADLPAFPGAVTSAGFPIVFDTTSGPMVNDANVDLADVTASNGVIHAIDKVLLPPTLNIVDTAQEAGLVTLVSAIDVAGARALLEGNGPFTVFAPTEQAFADLPEGLLQSLLDDPPALAEVLQYHVVPGLFFSGDLANLPVLATLQGQELTFEDVPPLLINDTVMILTKNVIATNGIVHVIDTVLVPAAEDE